MDSADLEAEDSSLAWFLVPQEVKVPTRSATVEENSTVSRIRTGFDKRLDRLKSKDAIPTTSTTTFLI